MDTCQSPVVLSAAGCLEACTGFSHCALRPECGLPVSGTVIQIGQGRAGTGPSFSSVGCPQLMGEPSANALLGVTPLLVHQELPAPGDLVWK